MTNKLFQYNAWNLDKLLPNEYLIKLNQSMPESEFRRQLGPVTTYLRTYGNRNTGFRFSSELTKPALTDYIVAHTTLTATDFELVDFSDINPRTSFFHL
ncbi:hypothetical protein [Lactiplantibacillus fabifermentans]|uniref:Uncharacterized protein n=2 Tax=Lactiplantibacillus fabifermentans TaxID=483011 RepID=A0A0R2NIF7_9LACO|nr:hypothetical protein [Lactiplantibacillus fabifermentans]ETY73120.1 hypothetical protein LFAB_14090 [Lactiplantibacillus fabifermentans T30PCM01]KRO25557.1 hypothetical protein DY78_GL001222 [Lactiplantibacillus fabifermentans DSM 21115]